MNLRLAIAIFLGIALSGVTALAQSGAGSIQGTVTDSSGAVVSGAIIHVVNNATAVTSDTKSNDVGFYMVPALFAGSYTVTIGSPNMKTYRAGVQVLVDQHAVIDASLSAGEVTQLVEVKADTVQLTTTDSGTIAATLENARINQIPMNGRVLTSLVAMMAPGVENGQRSNGLMAEALEYVADGVPLSNRQFGGMNQSMAQAPDPDSVQEMRVETTNTGAMYSAPGTVLITTKSGTNSLHGSLFETARNNAIGNAKTRAISAYTLSHLVRNEFGVSVGGPIVLPHVYHGKDKSFWSLAFEKYSLASSTPENVTVPTTAMKGGDWSALYGLTNPIQLYDYRTTRNAASCPANGGKPNAYCRDTFPNNQIPISLLSPTMKIMYDITQTPSTTGNPLVESNLATPNPSNIFIPTWTFRLDHTFNDNNRAYLRYTSNVQDRKSLRNYPSNSPYTIAADGFPAQASGIAYNPTSTYATSLGYTHIFSPNFFAETIVSNQWFSQHNFAGGTPLANYETKLGLPNNFGEVGFPNFGPNLITPYGGTQFVYGLCQIVSNVDENLTKIVNKHRLQFGGRYRHERFGYRPDQNADTVTFSSQASGVYDATTSMVTSSNVANTGNQNADAFLGAASSYSVQLEPPYEHFHDMEFDAYFQDNYRVAKNLTLNLGLRWEAHPAVWVKDGTMEAFDFKNDAVVLASAPEQLISKGYTTKTIITNLLWTGVKYETPQQAGLPPKLIYDNNLTFSPRVGIAWVPFGGKHGTVLRGAYGRYIYPTPVRTTYRPILRNNPYTASYSQSYTSAAQSPDGYSNYLLRVNPLPVVMGVNSTGVVNSSTTTALTPGFNPFMLNTDLPPAYVTQANFTIEQPLKGNSALRITYLFSHGSNLDQQYYFNSHPSTFTYETVNGAIAPNGGASVIGTSLANTYASTATGPYDQTTYGSSPILLQKSGWSNDNALQVDYQRLYHNGIAYQISYVLSKPFRLGGNGTQDSSIQTAAAFGASGLGTYQIPTGSVGTVGPYRLPPARPAGVASYAYWHDLDRWQNYMLDTAIPIHHIRFNGIYDLPLGTGKRFLGKSNRLLNYLVGGYQLAGAGNIATQDFPLTAVTNNSALSLNWGPISPIHVYKHAKPITDCTSGVCYKGYYWFNGYIPPSQNANAGCVTNCYYGLPTGVQPYAQPIDTNYNPTTAGGKAQDTYYNTNTVQINLTNGKTDRQNFVPSGGTSTLQYASNPWAHQVLNGPINYTIDLSLFKVIPITKRVALRFNFDVFNALNMQGFNNPSSVSGVQLMTSSANTPRQVQMTMRLQF